MAELSCRVSILSGRFLLAIRLLYGGRGLRLCCGLLPQRLHLLPQLLPRRTFGLGQFAKNSLAAHTGEVVVLEPMLQPLGDGGAGLARGPVHHLPIRLQVGPQPVQSLPAQAATLLVIEGLGVLPLAAAGQRGGAGGVVAVLPLQVVGQLRLLGEPLVVEAGGGCVQFAKLVTGTIPGAESLSAEWLNSASTSKAGSRRRSCSA
jgi:hypothetical protein